MAILGIDVTDRFEASSDAILNKLGIHFEKGYDFKEYRRLVAEARPDHQVGDPFNSDLHDLRQGTAVWTIGRDATGQIIHTQALRVLPTGANSVAEYFRQNFRDFSPSEMDIDFARSRYKPGPGAKSARGKVVYSGETWIDGADGRFRGTGLSSVLVRRAMLDTVKEFDANYMVGFMTEKTAYKGVSLRMGFMHVEPVALRWFERGNPDPMEGVMVYMSAEDIRFLLDLPNREIEALAA